MFERITLDRQGLPGPPVDIGLLSECLVFYDKVRVLVDYAGLSYLLRTCGTSEVLHLLKMKALKIESFENMGGVISRQVSGETVPDNTIFSTTPHRYLN